MFETKVIHPEGYQVTVDSWENDGDHRNTVVYNTTNKEQAEAMYQLARIFKDESISNISNRYGSGDDEEYAHVHKTFVQFAKNYPILFMYEGEIETPEDDDTASSWVHETASDLGLTSEDYFTRRCERVILTYSPVPIEVVVLEDSN